MFVTKIKIAVGLVLVLGLFGGGIAWKQSGGPGDGVARAQEQVSPRGDLPQQPPAKPPKTRAQLESEKLAEDKARQLDEARKALHVAQTDFEEADEKWNEQIRELQDRGRILLNEQRGKLLDLDLRIKKRLKDQALADSRIQNLSFELDREVVNEGRADMLEKRLKELKAESEGISNRLAQDESERENLRRAIDSRQVDVEREVATRQRHRDVDVNRARAKVEAAAARLRHLEGFDFPQESPNVRETVRDLYQKVEALERAVADLRKQIKRIEDRDSK